MICHKRTLLTRSAETHLPVLEDEAQALSERRLVPLVSDTGCVTGDAPGSEPFLLLGKVASAGRGRRQHEEDNDAHNHGDDSLEDDCDVRLDSRDVDYDLTEPSPACKPALALHAGDDGRREN